MDIILNALTIHIIEKTYTLCFGPGTGIVLTFSLLGESSFFLLSSFSLLDVPLLSLAPFSATLSFLFEDLDLDLDLLRDLLDLSLEDLRLPRDLDLERDLDLLE